MTMFYRAVGIATVLFLLAVNGVFAAGTSAPEGPNNETAASITVVDFYGRTISLERPAERIVSMAPSITETLFALGYGDRLVGRTTWCDYPAEAASVPAVGDLMNPDIESIVAADPDIVIASDHFAEESIRILESAGVRAAVLMGPAGFTGTYDGVIRPLSVFLGDPEAGENLVSAMELSIRKSDEAVVATDPPPSVYYVVGFGEGGDWTAGADTFIDTMISRSGGRNIAEDVEGWAYSKEALVQADPDIILVPEWGFDAFRSDPIYGSLRATTNDRLYAIEENIFVRQGPRLTDAYAVLVKIVSAASAP